MKTSRYTFFIVTIFLFCQNLQAHSGKVVKSFPLPGKFCTGLTFDGNDLWVTDYKADTIYKLDLTSGSILHQIPSPGFWPMGLAWDGKYLWNIDKQQKKIFKVDPSDGKIIMVIDTPCDNPQGLTWDGKTLLVSDPSADKIMKIDLSDGTAVQTFTSPANYVQGLTFDGIYLWCADRMSDEIYMIDSQNGEVIVILDSPGPYPRGLAWDSKYLWNVDFQTDEIYQIIRQDDELYKINNTRSARVTITHEVKPYGQGNILDLNVYIAIPEELLHQQILSKKFYPEDFNIVRDKWNQSYAHFNYQNIPSESTIRSRMVIDTKISEIDYFIFPDRCGSFAEIPPDIKKTYTANDSKYQIDDPYIQKLVKKVVGAEKNPYWIAMKIFNYLRNNIEYKLEGGWNIAPVILQRGTGSCSEYAFSFIALCRAAGLPARYVGSVVVRGDDASLDDVFHRWVEIYLPNYGWIPIDPSRGDKPLPRDRAKSIGHLKNSLLITTHCGGNSEYLGWYYNFNENFITDPQVHVNIEAFAEWEPLESEE